MWSREGDGRGGGLSGQLVLTVFVLQPVLLFLCNYTLFVTCNTLTVIYIYIYINHPYKWHASSVFLHNNFTYSNNLSNPHRAEFVLLGCRQQYRLQYTHKHSVEKEKQFFLQITSDCYCKCKDFFCLFLVSQHSLYSSHRFHCVFGQKSQNLLETWFHFETIQRRYRIMGLDVQQT